MTKEKIDYFQKIEKLSLALLKSHSQSERANPDRAELWAEVCFDQSVH